MCRYPCKPPPRSAIEQFFSTQDHTAFEDLGAVAYLLRSTAPLTYLLGVPGQGKSTLGQYLSQIHRAAILPGDRIDGRAPLAETVTDRKLPLRVDLKDYASWLSGHDPFGEDDPPTHPRPRIKSQRSLELFLVDFCASYSGGRQVSVEDVQSLLERYPTLLVLDGLDEVADPQLRAVIVDQINRTATRMGLVSKLRRFQILVTARPNAAGLAEPDKEIFQTLRLKPLTQPPPSAPPETPAPLQVREPELQDAAVGPPRRRQPSPPPTPRRQDDSATQPTGLDQGYLAPP